MNFIQKQKDKIVLAWLKSKFDPQTNWIDSKEKGAKFEPLPASKMSKKHFYKFLAQEILILENKLK